MHFQVIGILVLIFFITSTVHAYDGPVFDAMAQIDEKSGFDKSIKRAKEAGVAKVALFARSRKYLGQNEDELIRLRRKHPDFVILGSPKYFLLRDDLDKKYIQRTVNHITENNYLFVGEILYTHGDKSHGKQTTRGEKYIDPLGHGTIELLSKIKKLNIPIMTHWEVYEWERDWPKFSHLYSSHPNMRFIIPHMAFGTPEQVNLILSKHPNVYMTISKKRKKNSSYSDTNKSSKIGSGFLDDEGMIKKEWLEILVKYSDRLMFATDAHKKHRWKKYKKLIKRYRDMVDQLPIAVVEKISYKNAELMYGVLID